MTLSSLTTSVLSSLTTSKVSLGLSQDDFIKSGRRLEGIWNGNTMSFFITGNIETHYKQDSIVQTLDMPIYSESDIKWIASAAKAKNAQEISAVLYDHDQKVMAVVWDLFIICTRESFSVSEYLDWLKYIPIPQLPSVAAWTSPNYWAVVLKYLVRGDLNNAQKTLNMYQDKSQVQDLGLFIGSFPDRSDYASLGDFVEAWEVWKTRIRTDSNDLNIRMILRVLAGDKEEINRNPFLGWQEKLGAYCLFTIPSIGFQDMENLLSTILSDSDRNHIEEMYLSLLKLDFMALLRVASRTDAWLVAHLADYLVKEDLLDEQELHNYASEILKQSNFSIREWYILDFADAIFPLSWSLSFQYLLKCPKKGRKRISMYAERLDPDQINMAELEQFLLNHNFSVECKLLYAVAGRSLLSKNDLVNSLSFYAEAKNAPRVFSVVQKFLESNPQLSDYENILAPISGSTIVSYDALVFLSRYRDFLKYREAGSLKEAGEYLSSLFLSGSIPRQFWKFTYTDVQFLLENACIDENGCLELLRILEDEIQTPIIADLRSSLPLVWIDLEMTGLDHNNDSIMEVACAITNGNLEVISPPFECIIHQPKIKLDQMNEWCLKTHGESGLTQKCLESNLTLEEAQKHLLEFIKKTVPIKGNGILAGNSVHVDRIFLLKEFPLVIDHLHYRIVDVSTIKELAKRWSPNVFADAPKKKLSHRAYDDIMESIQELEYYKSSFFNV